MIAMLAVIIMAMLPIPSLAAGSMLALWIFMALAILDMVLLGTRVKRKARAKFGERREKGLGWYAAMRSLQMRFMRLPKAQVKRGQYPD